MKFSQVIGQEDIINKLRHSVAEERVSHAQILAGPEGNGKLAVALAFARYISCEKRVRKSRAANSSVMCQGRQDDPP
ncbi:MAG: hypothetical protein R2744_11975 [Bacteroidales bacterium]